MDLNGDGHQDVISGSYHPGDLYLFKGQADGSFEAGQIIKGADGKPVNVGFASAVYAADFFGEGVFDLVIGNIEGRVFYVRNEGTKHEPKFATARPLTAGKAPIRTDGDAGPTVADWDGDGTLDLIVGSNDGSVRVFANKSKRGEPELDAARMLLPATGRGGSPWGVRAKPHVADFNGDGRLDLLVGDFISGPRAPEPAPQRTEASQLAELVREHQRNQQRLRDPQLSADEREQLVQKQKELLDQIRESQGKSKETARQPARRAETHGHVWLFVRKAAPEQSR